MGSRARHRLWRASAGRGPRQDLGQSNIALLSSFWRNVLLGITKVVPSSFGRDESRVVGGIGVAGLGRLSIAGGLRAQGAVVAALLGGVFRLCCLITLAVFGFPNAVVTYQLTAARSDESRLLVGRDSARKWSQAAWAPGATLIWHIAGSDPDWDTEWFGSAAGFAPVFEEALATWSEVSTADISWVLEGVEHFDEEDGENSRARNFVAIDATADLRGYASYWEHRGTSGNGNATHVPCGLAGGPPSHRRTLGLTEARTNFCRTTCRFLSMSWGIVWDSYTRRDLRVTDTCSSRMVWMAGNLTGACGPRAFRR